MKQFIRFFAFVSIAFLFLTIGTAFAEKVTFVKEYNYNASDLDSKVSSRTIALEQVKRLLLEELGTYLISETEVKNFRLTKDQVTTYSAGIVSAEVVDEKWDGKTYYLKAKVAADPAEVIKSLQNIVNDKQKSKELEDVRKKAAEFSKEIERLKKELVIAKTDTKKPEQKADIKKDEGKVIYTSQALIKQYNEAVKGLSATDWFEKGYESGIAGNYKEALNAFNKAIELSPRYAVAYYNRGVVYSRDLGNHQQAINDFNKAIELNPQLAAAYYNRGTTYSYLGNNQQAINDYNKAIQLNPNDVEAYNNRGVAYRDIGNLQQAINDYNKAIVLDPNDVAAYNNRGIIYGIKGQYDGAIKDFNKAIALNPNYATVYNNRGNAYSNKRQYERAIEDFNKAIVLNPNYAGAYYNIACMYSVQNKPAKACSNLKKSIEKGYKGWERIKQDKDFDNIRNETCYKEIMAGK